MKASPGSIDGNFFEDTHSSQTSQGQSLYQQEGKPISRYHSGVDNKRFLYCIFLLGMPYVIALYLNRPLLSKTTLSQIRI